MTTRTRSAPRSGAVTAAGPPPLSATGLATLLTGALLSMADFFIVNVALPTIGRDLQATPAMLELVVAGYGISYAVLLVVGGRLGDAFGRRRLFLAGMAAFTVASLACGLAPSALALVAARVVQGATAALMVPQVLATIQATGDPLRRGRAIGRYGATGGIALMGGQLLGGLIVAADLAGSGWRPIFLVNVPIGLVGLALAVRHVPDTRAARPAQVDVAGTVLLGVALLAVLVPLTEGHALGWPTWAWGLLGLATVSAAAFVRVEARRERSGRVPLVPPSIIRMPSVARGLVIAFPFFAGFGGFMFCYALAAQRGLGFGAVAAGATLVPMGAAFLAASLLTAGAVARFGRRVLIAGALTQGSGLVALIAVVLTAWPGIGPLALGPVCAVIGFGQGLVMSPLFRTVLSGVPADVAGAASGVLVTTQQSALAVGTAGLGTLFATLAQQVGMAGGFVAVLATQVVVAAGIAVAMRRLPHPDHPARPLRTAAAVPAAALPSSPSKEWESTGRFDQ